MSTSLQIQLIQAVGFTVANVERSVAFYMQALEFEVVSDTVVKGQTYSDTEEIADTEVRIVTLKLGDEKIRLTQYLGTKGKPVPPDSHSNDLWFQHLAIVVNDMDRAYAHLRQFDIEPISTAPQTIPPGNKEAAYIQAFKFKDPDRHDLELIWFPPDKGQPKWHQKHDQLFLGIDHTAIAITHTEESLYFYRDLLGMHVDGGSFNWRETQARMDGLPNAKVRITALRPALGGFGIELLDYIEPTNGRSIPSDLKSYDIAYVQAEFMVSDIHEAMHQLRQKNIQIGLPKTIQLGDCTAYEGCLIKDLTGHALLLIAEPAA